jgi:hypothetical protein
MIFLSGGRAQGLRRHLADGRAPFTALIARAQHPHADAIRFFIFQMVVLLQDRVRRETPLFVAGRINEAIK